MDKPESASWPPDFPKSARLRILADQRSAYDDLEWIKESDGDYLEHVTVTPYGETLSIVRDESLKLYPMYQVNGEVETHPIHEVEFPPQHTWVRARLALSTYVIDLWASYAAWEEHTLMEMSLDPEDM